MTLQLLDLARHAENCNPEEFGEILMQSYEAIRTVRNDFARSLDWLTAERVNDLLWVEAWETVTSYLIPIHPIDSGLNGHWHHTISVPGYWHGRLTGGALCKLHHPLSSGGGPLYYGGGVYAWHALLAASLRAYADHTEMPKWLKQIDDNIASV